MNILFLTLAEINSIDDRGIYTDLLRYFVRRNHFVTIITPKERRKKIATNLLEHGQCHILQVKTLNIVSTNIIEKGLGTLAIEYQYLAAIRKYLPYITFDLILYSTPPITFGRVIKAIKKRDNAMSYLLLKDIFPQNAVDLGMIKRGGLLHRFFRYKEKQLYRQSDFIGCMSPANVAYVLAHNPEVIAERVEVCPNSIEPDKSDFDNNTDWRQHYNIPKQATIFIYGGNLGKPQGLEFLKEVLKSNDGKLDRYFIVIGSGTEKAKLSAWFTVNPLSNAIILEALPKKEYDKLVRSCDVGLIFLDRRFTIPNYPSRLLTYMEYRMPVLIGCDEHTDIGAIAEQSKYGLLSIHGNLEMFNVQLNKLVGNFELIKEMGENGYEFMMKNYTVDKAYEVIMKKTKIFAI